MSKRKSPSRITKKSETSNLANDKLEKLNNDDAKKDFDDIVTNEDAMSNPDSKILVSKNMDKCCGTDGKSESIPMTPDTMRAIMTPFSKENLT